MNTLEEVLAEARGITCDSRHVQSGFIFVAIRGRTADGNSYIKEAVKKGALAIVTDSSAPVCADIPVVKVPNARKTLADLAAEYYGHPSKFFSLVGVTGSNGKTTVTYMLEHIFRQAGCRAGLIGTIRVNLGRQNIPSTLTTPDAVTLQHYLAQMRHSGVTHAAMEVSAQGVEMHRVDNVHLKCGLLTNICPDHLDFHGSFVRYLAAKKQFLTLLAPETPLIVNADDPHCREMVRGYQGRIFTCSLSRPADIQARIIQSTARGSSFKLILNSPEPVVLEISQSLPGRHNIENAMFAAAAALVTDIPPEAVVKALTGFRGVERRMEYFRQQGISIIDDTALNPGSIDAVFKTLENFTYRRLVVVNAIRGQRGTAINSVNAQTLSRWQTALAFKLFITASADRTGPADSVSAAECDAFLNALDQTGADYCYHESLADSLTAALSAASSGDMIVLLGAQGMDEGRQILLELMTPGRMAGFASEAVALPC